MDVVLPLLERSLREGRVPDQPCSGVGGSLKTDDSLFGTLRFTGLDESKWFILNGFGLPLGMILAPFWYALAPFWFSFGSFDMLLAHLGCLCVPSSVFRCMRGCRECSRLNDVCCVYVFL